MINVRSYMKDAERILMFRHHVSFTDATPVMLAEALSEAAMLAIGKDWAVSEQARNKTRQAHYLSAEYLTGRMIFNNLFNLGILSEVETLLSAKGIDIAVLEDVEDAALGNGGLGRLAACFLDSAATHDLPLTGYGLRYRYGLFKQKIENGAQTELPDDWTKYGDPWSIRRDELSVLVKTDVGDIRAVPYDMPVIGYETDNVGTLRLWQTESPHEFDFALFNDYRYAEACKDKNAAEDITKVLYPNDWDEAGKLLRLRQQYVLSSASLQDILRTFEARRGTNYRYFARENVIQLNDTHPVLAIPELIRLLTERGLTFPRALDIAAHTFAYTNHTVMPEALEKWSMKLIQTLSPDIANIIKKLDRRSMRDAGMHIVKDGSVCMADMAVYMGFAVNGVAKIHSDLLKRSLFRQWFALYPEKFQNKTNGITQRRWLGLCNPELCSEIEKRIGDGFMTDLSELEKLNGNMDELFISAFQDVKRLKKRQLSHYILQKEGVELPPDFIFDVQIKRLHEYKRQLMNALSIYDLYMEMKAGNLPSFPRVAFIFGAKAAPGYARAKAVIHYICSLAELINADPDVNDRMRVCFVSNYNCSYAEKIIPAADFSEQISPAGTEASGTGNMKLMLNGAVTIGTFDGANIEITEAAGLENEVIFGADIQEIERIRDTYDPREIYDASPRVKRAVDSLVDAGFEDADGALAELRTSLLDGASWHKPDHYFVLKDFMAYQDARVSAFRMAAEHPAAFAGMCVKNIASAGIFSSDRTVAEYARDIWNIQPLRQK